jgi:glycosyltransferase involved in cell wall biosynthesis
VNVDDYDLAILHFDENVLAPGNTNGVIGPEWGMTFQWFVRNIKLPKVAICHGTPQFYGQYNINYKGSNLLQVIEEERRKLTDFLGDVLVVANSFQAQREWGFRKSKVIWHGFDPTEFPQTSYEKGILSPVGPLLLSRPHYRGYFVYRDVFKEFPKEYSPKTLCVPEPDILYDGNQYAIGKFQNYVNELRKYSIYFNPTLRSPMPRARGEAMMCGLVTVSAHNHDIDLFIKNGVNGFYSDNSFELRDYLLYLSENPEQTRKIGQAGRQTAIDLFNHDRYLQQWEDTITDLIGERN